MTKGKWILFELKGLKPKTKVWAIVARDDKYDLGTIEWIGRWHGYGFCPKANTMFEKTCLRDIADFIEEQNRLHRMAR